MEAVTEVSSPKKRTPKGWHEYWMREKAAAEKRLRKFTKQGNDVVQRFVDERAGDVNQKDMHSRLNLFHANVSTLCSMLYGNTPKTEVTREHQDPDDDLARVYYPLTEPEPRVPSASSGSRGQAITALAEYRYAWYLVWCLDRALPKRGRPPAQTQNASG